MQEGQRFARWFALYLLLDLGVLVSALMFRWDALKDPPLPIAILIFAVPLYARWHQRQLALKLLKG